MGVCVIQGGPYNQGYSVVLGVDRVVIEYCIKNSLGRYSMERAIDMLYSGNSVNEILNLNLLKPVSEESIMNLIKKCDIDVNSNMADIMRKLNSMNEGVIDPSIVARLINTVRNKDSN